MKALTVRKGKFFMCEGSAKLTLSPLHWPDTMSGELHKNTPICNLYILLLIICLFEFYLFSFIFLVLSFISLLWPDSLRAQEKPTSRVFYPSVFFVSVYLCICIWVFFNFLSSLYPLTRQTIGQKTLPIGADWISYFCVFVFLCICIFVYLYLCIPIFPELALSWPDSASDKKFSQLGLKELHSFFITFIAC